MALICGVIRLRLLIVMMAAITIAFGAIESTSCTAGNKCIYMPPGCTTGCGGSVDYKSESVENGGIHFIVQTIAGFYTAMGISLDKLMPITFSVGCVENDGNTSLHRYWIPNELRPEIISDTETEKFVIDGTTKTADGVAICTFTLQLPIHHEGIVFNSSAGIYILVAHSRSRPDNLFIIYHADNKTASETTVWEVNEGGGGDGGGGGEGGGGGAGNGTGTGKGCGNGTGEDCGPVDKSDNLQPFWTFILLLVTSIIWFTPCS